MRRVRDESIDVEASVAIEIKHSSQSHVYLSVTLKLCR